MQSNCPVIVHIKYTYVTALVLLFTFLVTFFYIFFNTNRKLFYLSLFIKALVQVNFCFFNTRRKLFNLSLVSRYTILNNDCAFT